jgi:nitrate reductase / nitrite oxidoreductase, beta subunit
VPPLLPVMASVSNVDNDAQAEKVNPIGKVWPDSWLYDTSTKELFGTIDDTRFPLEYMASLFSVGDTGAVADRLKKLMAVRLHRRQVTVGDVKDGTVEAALADTELTPRIADDIYYLTSLAKFDDRFVIPAAHREQAVEMMEFAGDVRGNTGFGFKVGSAERGA